MLISATEFQQRVGYYLSLVEQGTRLVVEKKKPHQAMFVISMGSSQKPGKNKRAKQLKNIQKLQLQFEEKSGVEFQRRVRQ